MFGGMQNKSRVSSILRVGGCIPPLRVRQIEAVQAERDLPFSSPKRPPPHCEQMTRQDTNDLRQTNAEELSCSIPLALEAGSRIFRARKEK